MKSPNKWLQISYMGNPHDDFKFKLIFETSADPDCDTIEFALGPIETKQLGRMIESALLKRAKIRKSK